MDRHMDAESKEEAPLFAACNQLLYYSCYSRIQVEQSLVTVSAVSVSCNLSLSMFLLIVACRRQKNSDVPILVITSEK